MKDEGFNQKIYVDWSTGFVFGGNEYNCGTWMDKMGESEKAGNKGFPGTPRTGAAVEITGLLKSTVRFAIELSKKGILKHDYVVNQHGDQVTFQAWNDKIQETFECAYYVPLNADDDSNYDIDRQVVHRRGIYKDLYRSTNTYEDYQLRPNFTIAMVVAPELFVVDHAINAIAMADQILRGPVGMATLDPDDLNYRPYYNNSEDSTDFQTAKGRNYHQGPDAFTQLDPAQVRQLKEAFTLLDSDGNGTVSSQDLAEMMVSLGLPADVASEAEATRMLALMPQPLTFSSFLTGMSGLLGRLSSVADLNQAFSAFEDDAPAAGAAGQKSEGRIHVDELRELLVESGMSEADVNQCFKSFTKPGGFSGDWFYYKDFISLVKGDEEVNSN